MVRLSSIIYWAVRSVGRSLHWHCRGREFESRTVHHYSIKSDPQRLHYHRFLINIAIAFARIACKKTWFQLFGPFSRPGHHFILRPCARMCAGLVFTAPIVARYCAMFSIGRRLRRRREQNGFCNYFPDDSRRSVVRCSHSMNPSSESAISLDCASRRMSEVYGRPLINTERTTVSNLRAHAMRASL